MSSPQSYLNISFTFALGFQTKVRASNSSKWEQHLFELFLLKLIFLWLQMLSMPLNKGDFYKTRAAYRLALIHSTCSSNRQSELKVTHTNTPAVLPRFKNVIFRHHYAHSLWHLHKLSYWTSKIAWDVPKNVFLNNFGNPVWLLCKPWKLWTWRRCTGLLPSGSRRPLQEWKMAFMGSPAVRVCCTSPERITLSNALVRFMKTTYNGRNWQKLFLLWRAHI